MCSGNRDRTKCFYCDGGLEKWGFNDDPWEEHAKWYPHCEFLKSSKGPLYVHRVLSRFPNLNRPVMNTSANTRTVQLVTPSNGSIVSGIQHR